MIHPPNFSPAKIFVMYYVYVLKSDKDAKLYTGCTSDLQRRFFLHNTGKVPSTNGRTPLKLVYYEAFLDQNDAFVREKWLKTGWGRNQLQKLLHNYFKNLGG